MSKHLYLTQYMAILQHGEFCKEQLGFYARMRMILLLGLESMVRYHWVKAESRGNQLVKLLIRSIL